jgi:glycosyltransferase involved in cell wall biosynthesis
VAFLKQCPATLIPVPSAGNWWVDPELYRPLPDAKQDADLVMVAAWADFKRHWAFFAALGKLRQEGRVLKTLLAGYPSGLTMQEIADLASYFGIRDQIELYEWLPPEEVNRLVNRAKVNVLWSRREGFNRAVVEGMFAGLPFVMRKGHNYGDPQAHVNAQTGCYATEEELPRVLVEMVDHPEKYSPREWAMANMTCLHGTKILNESIRGEALRRGEPWTEDLVGHVSVLHGNKYLNPGDAERFRPDYAFLETMLR